MRSGEIIADRFVIESLAGSGGMGEIYRAMDRETGELVAIKVLLGERRGDLDRFEREARLLASVAHPRVVRYVTHGVLSAGDPYLVMEWLEGHDLSKRLDRGAIDAAETIIIASGAAEALGAVHDRGIVHRDLKPSNLFLVRGRSEDVKLVDFGIAWSDDASKLTGTGMLLGTAAYTSPEQATGGASIGAQADVFSLGCVIFECLTGEKAFDGANFMAILTKILFQESPRVRERRPELPASLCSLVDRMLSKAPNARPANGNAVFEALRDLGDVHSNHAEKTVERCRVTSLTQSEQRAVAVIFIGFSDGMASDQLLSLEAAKHGGRLERLFNGSAAVMLSGAAVATDLAAQAARCALALRRQAHGRRISLTMGRSEETGRVQVGRAIDRAAKLLDGLSAEQAANDHVTLDDATVGLLDARFDVLDDSGIFVLRAEREVTEVRTLMGKPTPCVGRDRELRQLEETFDDCVNESQARAILLTGPPGMGKSRLGREIVQRLRAQASPPAIWIARGELLGAGSALSMLAELVRGACGIRVGEPLDMRRDKLRQRIADHVPARHQKQVAGFLGEIVGAHFPDEDNVQLRSARQDAQIMSDQIRTAFVEFLRAQCDAGPLCILLEDLHWGDGATVRILDTALRELTDKPLFLLALGRPEVDDVFPKLWVGRGLETKRLLQLGKKAGEQLVKHVLGSKAGADTIERIVRLADGNAFYLEELIRATAEGKGVDLPETVVAMVQSRLVALSDAGRRILRAASVFGETFWAGGVATLLGATSGLTHSATAIRALVEAELVTKKLESRFGGEDEYAFRHALVREGAYVMLTEHDSKLGHRLAGEWLEEHGETDALVLAGHFLKGGEGEKAATFFLRVAETATASGDSDTAITRATQGLDCGPTENVRIELLGIICEASGWQIQRAIQARLHAEELLRRVEPGSRQWVQGCYAVLMHLFTQGQIPELRAMIDTLLVVMPAEDAVSIFIHFAGTSSLQIDLLGNTQLGDALMEKARDISAKHSADPLVIATYANRLAARILIGNRGNPWEARERAIESCHLFQDIGHQRMYAVSNIFQGFGEWCLGQLETATDILENPLLSDSQLAYVGSMRQFALIWLYADAGALEKASILAKAHIESSRQIPQIEARGRWLLAEILRRQGEFEDAGREIALAQSMAFPLDQPGTYATLAALHLAEGKIENAVAAAEKGMALYEAMDACGFSRAAFLRLAHAECLHAAGRNVDAKQAIDKAKHWLMNMAAGIRNDSYRNSFLENVPENRRIIELAAAWENIAE